MALAVEIEGLGFAYPNGGPELHDITLAIPDAELCCLLGPNGAGKTTLLRCLLGLLAPSRGSIRIHGQALARLSPRALARLVAYVPQHASTPFPFTALDIAEMGRTPYLPMAGTPTAADRKRALDQLDRLGIAHLADRAFTKLSGGERQLVLLARALVQEAQVLVLDEPTAALDYGNEVQLLQLVGDLARQGHAILMTTHQPAHALAYAGHAVMMRKGRVVADGPPDAVVTGELLSDLYGVPIKVAQVDGVSLPIPYRPSPSL